MRDGDIPGVSDVTDLAAARAARVKTTADDRPAEFSDDALALRFADRLSSDLRYVETWGRWQRWTDGQWCIDNTLAVFDEARATCRAAAVECKKRKIGAAITSAKTIAAVERLARSDRRIAATAEQWDAEANSFNTPWSQL
jgi:putative DNA primase/helicase